MTERLESDEALISRMLPRTNPDSEGRSQAWQEWIARYRGVVLAYIRYKNHTGVRDDEILEDTLYTAYVKIERGHYQYKPGIRLVAYVKRIAEIKVLEEARRDARVTPLDEAFSLASDDDLEAIYAEADGEQLAQFLAELPPRRRQILMLTFYENLGYSEIAQKLGIREDLVRQEKSRAIKALRTKLSASK
jgi:RNA polymerase sigma factor (sigma-70 family)